MILSPPESQDDVEYYVFQAADRRLAQHLKRTQMPNHLQAAIAEAEAHLGRRLTEREVRIFAEHIPGDDPVELQPVKPAPPSARLLAQGGEIELAAAGSWSEFLLGTFLPIFVISFGITCLVIFWPW